MDQIPKKSLGQHWLHDKASLEAMCRAAQITKNDIVLEIGPGLGTLTKKLVDQAKAVIAIEFDHELAKHLPQRVRDDNLSIVEADVLKFDFTQLPPDYKLAANIPYYLTSHLLRQLGETTNKPSLAALLVQKEVAERVSAEPGQMSLLSVSVQLYFEVSRDIVVPAALFIPPPKVDSQILILKRRDQPLFEIDNKAFFRIVKAGFSERRKKLRGSLSGGLQISKDQADELLEKAGIDGNLRAQNLSLDDWYKLYKTLEK